MPTHDATETLSTDTDATPVLLVLVPFAAPLAYRLPVRGHTVLGRAAECDVVIDDKSVSRRHAKLGSELDGSIWLEDLGSHNGTRLGGERVERGARVAVPLSLPFEIGAIRAMVVPLWTRIEERPRQGDMIAVDPATRRAVELARRYADSTLPVLLQGETGTGKEVFARLVHDASPRHAARFVALSVAEIPEELLEAELFGHVKGAFSGAQRERRGVFEMADGGTLFLDEVAELQPRAQAAMLRVLQEKCVRPVGSTVDRAIDVRVISASHRSLEDAVREGQFREDLYYRLSGATIPIPPLRARPLDIAPLARACLDDAARDAARVVPTISPEARAALESYAWPGNVRELRHAMTHALLFAEGDTIQLSSLPDAIRQEERPRALAAAVATTEQAKIVAALEQADGHQSRAAELLGISRRTLINKLERYGLPRPRKGQRETE